MLLREMRHELLLLLGDLFSLCRAHRRLRGVSWQMDIVQSALGFMEDIRQRPMHRGAARRWGQSGRADQAVGILAGATRNGRGGGLCAR